MKETVRITIKTKRDGETLNWESEGVLSKAEEGYIVSYPDYSSNALTNNRLELNGESMRLIRSGAINSDMLFIKNVETTGIYEVLYLKTDMTLKTIDYKFEENESSLKTQVNYDLFDMGNGLISSELIITIDRI